MNEQLGKTAPVLVISGGIYTLVGGLSVYLPFLFVGAYMAFLGCFLSFAFSAYQRLEVLRSYSELPVKEWPKMTEKELAYLLWICEQADNIHYSHEVERYRLDTHGWSIGGETHQTIKGNHFEVKKTEWWCIPKGGSTYRPHKGRPENEPDAYPEWDQKWARKHPLFY